MPSVNPRLLLHTAYDRLRQIADEQEIDLDATSKAIGKSRRYLSHTLERGSEMGFVTYFMLCQEIGADPLQPIELAKRHSTMKRYSPFPEEKIGDLLHQITKVIREQREAEEPPTLDQALHYWRDAGRRFARIHPHLSAYCDVYAPPDEDDTLNPVIIGARSLTREVLKTDDVAFCRSQRAASGE